MNLRFLETFIWVARLRNFSATADRLNSTQAAVSNRIATLERDLNVRLFERDLRNVRLTSEGRLLLERATEIVRLTTEFREAVGNAHLMRGTITIGTIDSIVYAWLPRLIERMKSDYPGISLVLSVDTSLNLAPQIPSGEVDLGLIMGPVLGPNLVNLELGEFECCWVTRPDPTLPAGPVDLEWIATRPLLAYSKGSLPHQAVLQLLDTHGIERSTVRIYNSNSVATIMRLVRDGVGTAVLPEIIVREFVSRGEMHRLDVAAPMPPLRFHAVYEDQRDNRVPALVAAMAVAVAREFHLNEVRKPGS